MQPIHEHDESLVLGAIRAAERAAPAISIGGNAGCAGLERAPKPPDMEDVIRAQVDQAFVDILRDPNPLVWGGDNGPQDAA